MAAKRLFLIDGHALCYRSFFAIRELSTSSGKPTNAVFGFVNTLRKILREQKPDYLAVCFDSKEKTHREEKYEQYKIQRPSVPEGLIEQVPIIKDVIKAYNLAVYEAPGYEADDIIATLVKKIDGKNVDVTVVTDDKDLFQLADKNVAFYSARKDKLLTQKDLVKTLGFEPERIIDFIGLAGDKSDNIPGIAGIGEVTARNLLKNFGSLEDIYAHLDEVDKPKVKEKLEKEKESAFLSKELAELAFNVPVKFSLSKLKVEEPDENKLHEIFRSLEFRRLAEEYAEEGADEEDVSVKKAETKKLLKQIKKEKRFAFMSSAPEEASLFDEAGLLVCVQGKEVFQLESNAIKELKAVINDKKILKITYDLKKALKDIKVEGLQLTENVFDVKLAAYLAGLSYSSTSASDLAWRYLKLSISDTNRGAKETAALLALESRLRKELEERKLIDLHDSIEVPLSTVLYQMEMTGVNIDTKLLEQLSKDCAKRIAGIEKKVYKISGEEFNLNSPKQLSHVLFEKLELPVIKKTKTGYSTDESVLTTLSGDHEVPALILEYRQLSKLKSTYIDALPKMVEKKDGRIHAEFDQIGAETGRFSSRNPNLQNIPIRTELGRQIRKAFIPSKKSNLLLAADYSQIELRILAHFSQDETLVKAFEQGEDIHNLTASLIFNVEQKDVDYHMRDTAKRVNFGIIYGMSAYGLAKDLNISGNEAQAFIDTYFARYPKVKEFIDSCIKDCEKNGYATTILNRRRYIPEINSKNNAVKQFAQRQAMNTPIQGSAADLMKLAMINVQKQIEEKRLESTMIMTVHDELVFDMVKKEKKQLSELVRKEMEEPMSLSVPIKVSMEAGDNWMEIEEI